MVRKQYIQFPAFLVNQAEQNKPSQWEERKKKKYWPFSVRARSDAKVTAAIILLSQNYFPYKSSECIFTLFHLASTK